MRMMSDIFQVWIQNTAYIQNNEWTSVSSVWVCTVQAWWHNLSNGTEGVSGRPTLPPCGHAHGCC